MLLHPELGMTLSEEARLEFRCLAESAGLEVVSEIKASRHRADPSTLVGSGKVEELSDLLKETQAGLLLVNGRLSPIQERNLSRQLECPVLDRTTLILDIFAQRARSHEGQLQVELAQLRHLSTRLIRGWTHLERQRGGIGMRGPGETQLETDRRLVAQRIRQLTTRLGRVERRRSEGRRARDRSDVPVVALVGYTNAGKSTLFNRLTEADVMAKDQLFATLDPTVRRMQGDQGSQILLSDTVGFIRDLPHELIAAFRSTLEETAQADLILHVVDAADPDRLTYQAVVEEVLADMGASDVPTLFVMNKVDQADHGPGVDRREDGTILRAHVSALTGAGIEQLQSVIRELLSQGRIHRDIALPVSGQRLRAKLFDLGAVRSESIEPDGTSLLRVELDRRDAQLLGRLGGADGQMAQQLLLN
ncbi:MAG TPA: ribosome rescue GTPase HflX [Wenzhouxiangella sp.]